MSSKGRVILSALVSLGLPVALWAADGKVSPPRLTAAQIVEKNIEARGGLKAWHSIQTMSWAGKMEAGVGDSVTRSQMFVRNQWAHKGKAQKTGAAADPNADAPARDESAKQVDLPFVMEMKRPAKSRVEVEFNGKTAVQVYDGKNGWMKRPYLNRDDWEPFNPEQSKEQASASSLDGPLFDYAAKGTKVELEGMEAVEGHDAYKLKLTMKGGAVQHVWIDAQSFLDVRVEGTPRRMDGKMHTVWVYQRDFRPVQGVQVPFVLETAVDGYAETHKMVIEKVGLNPVLDDSLFARPKT